MTSTNEMIETNSRECRAVLDRLLAAQAFAFDDELKFRLPTKPGLYVIRRQSGNADEYLHAGQSPKAKDGLRSRVWQQHFRGGGTGAGSDLVQKVIDRGQAQDKPSAQLCIRNNCVVQWIVEENVDLRCWAEHYILSVLRPIWGR